MCGRFTLGVEPVELQEAFDLSEAPTDWVIRENIAPTQPVAVLARADDRRIEYMRWGLIPSWAKDISIGSKMFNARAETIQEKPSFRTAFARRRCLIPADGFYEWQKQEKGPSKPFRFQLLQKKPFAFAGLWELWRSPEGDELKSCTIITTEANELVAKVHPRMPVILDADTCWSWIEQKDLLFLQAMLKPFEAGRMESAPVSKMPVDPV
jgi:putative SOS response-associated peptidase YedK